jgi:hypothetical protein
MNTCTELDLLDVEILNSIERAGCTTVPSEAEDSGHASWLLERGYLDFEDGILVVTEQGRFARDEARRAHNDARGRAAPF